MSIIPTTTTPTTTGTTPHAPIATLPAGSQLSTGSATSSTSAGMNGVNSDTFLQLLVAQMKYQDPNNPVNSTQFLAQTASFEEVQELGTLQKAITNLVTSQQNTAATSMLGQTVQATDSNGQPISGVVSGVQLTSNGPVLQIGAQTAALASVTAVGSASNSTTTTTTSSSSTNPQAGTSAASSTPISA